MNWFKRLWDWIKKKVPYEIIEIRENIDVKHISIDKNGKYSTSYTYSPRKKVMRKKEIEL